VKRSGGGQLSFTTMRYTINTGWGKLMADKLALSKTAGKTFVVGKSALAYRSQYAEIFSADHDGTLRFFSTVSAALAACTANSGDTIFVLPGHTETITAAAGVDVNVAGVNIIGLGSGSLVPTFTFTTAVTASFNVTAANVTIQNIAYVAGIDNITAMINVSGAYVSFLDCFFTTNTAALGAVLGILTAATATSFRVERCRFIGTAANSGTTTTAQIKHEVGVDYVIKDCYFTGKMTQAILNATTVLRGLIDNNRFVIATGTKAIAMESSSTPFITNNRINVPSGTAPIVCAAGFVAGNVYSAAAGVTAGTASTI
jgi:hypothetical protein